VGVVARKRGRSDFDRRSRTDRCYMPVDRVVQMAVSELLLWSLNRRASQTSLSVGRDCRLSLSFRRILRFTGQSLTHSLTHLHVHSTPVGGLALW